MQHALNAKYAEHDGVYDAPSDDMAQLRSRLLEAEPGSTHARHLQRRLLEAYAQTSPEEKLPGRQRLAIIVALTSALWMLIAVSVVVVVNAIG